MGKKTAVIGSILIIGLATGMLLYQKKQDESKPIAQTETVEQEEYSENISGYEDEEGLVKYMLYQLQQENLELALRGCAIRKLAEGFNLETYIEYTETFDPLALIPPSNWESTAYLGISEMRMAEYYTNWFEKCREYLGGNHEVKFFSIEEDVPENPDGKYYENRKTICDILGARTVEEVIVYVQIDGEVKELRWTLARFGKSWRVLLFTSLDGYGQEEPDIRESQKRMETEAEVCETEDILPVNYAVANNNAGETPTETIQKFFTYLMRQDVWTASSYVKLYEGEQPNTTAELLKLQGQLAEQEQAFYYRLFFSDQNTYTWYFRDLAARAGNIIEDLRSDQIIMLNIGDVQLISEPSDTQETYRFGYGYGKGWYGCNITLVNENGWRITNIEWQ